MVDWQISGQIRKKAFVTKSKMKVRDGMNSSLSTWLSKYQQNMSSFIPAPEVRDTCHVTFSINDNLMKIFIF